MVKGSKLVEGYSMEKMRWLTLMIFVFLLIPLVLSEKIIVPKGIVPRNDSLLDFPIITQDDVDTAKRVARTNQTPENVSLAQYMEGNETRIAWNITFGDPVNKEVLIDAVSGKVLSVRSIGLKEKLLGQIKTLLKDKVFIGFLSFLVVCWIILKLKKRRVNE